MHKGKFQMLSDVLRNEWVCIVFQKDLRISADEFSYKCTLAGASLSHPLRAGRRKRPAGTSSDW
jgi:hypothetical protein